MCLAHSLGGIYSFVRTKRIPPPRISSSVRFGICVRWDIQFCANKENPTLEDFILGLFDFYTLRVGRTRVLEPYPCDPRLSRGKTSKLDSPLLKISSLDTTDSRTNKFPLSLKTKGVFLKGEIELAPFPL